MEDPSTTNHNYGLSINWWISNLQITTDGKQRPQIIQIARFDSKHILFWWIQFYRRMND